MACPNTSSESLIVLVGKYLRAPASITCDDAGQAALVFTPPLTVAEQAAFGDLQLMSTFGVSANLTLAEFQAIKPDLALGRAFLGIASPTNAQAIAAEKAIIRVIGALLRDA